MTKDTMAKIMEVGNNQYFLEWVNAIKKSPRKELALENAAQKALAFRSVLLTL